MDALDKHYDNEFQYNLFNAIVKRNLNLNYNISYEMIKDLNTKQLFKNYFALFGIDKSIASEYLKYSIKRIGNAYVSRN